MKILIGLSGGVDSSYSAYLLQKEGYEVEGVYMKLHKNREDNYHLENIERVKNVAKALNIKYHILDLSDKFRDEVYNPFIESYKNGLTPNPCAICNREIKFGAMLEFANSLGIDKIATGHYVKNSGEFISVASDTSKDQSYFLFNIKRKNLKNIIFPLSNYTKDRVKEEAKKIDLIKYIAEGSESNDICFVENTYIDILKEYMNTDIEGEVVKNGKVVGSHKGYMHYTIGKRRGFTFDLAQTPHYVTKIIPEKNQIEVGEKDALERDYIESKNLNMFVDETEFECEVKIRYRSKAVKCRVEIEKNIAKIYLQESVYGVASGQASVFYRDSKVLGGGWII